jgi:hypothetical protein
MFESHTFFFFPRESAPHTTIDIPVFRIRSNHPNNIMMARLTSTFLLYLLHLVVDATAASEMCVSDTGVYTVNVDLFAGELGKLQY